MIIAKYYTMKYLVIKLNVLSFTLQIFYCSITNFISSFNNNFFQQLIHESRRQYLNLSLYSKHFYFNTTTNKCTNADKFPA